MPHSQRVLDPHKKYRPDIDGLRAIAVAAVIAFHAGIPGFKGGFTGVDSFFVISGFLISGIIFDALDTNSFSFADFYARRAVRILPSLITVLIASIAIAWAVLFRSELAQFGTELIGGSLFTANFVFWHRGGYFALAEKPLLHLWSLAVEEQFYLIWPPLVIVAARLRWNRLATIVTVLLLSFAANIWAVATSRQETAFYLPFSRLWEILAGALLLEIVRRSANDSNAPASTSQHLLSIAGSALLLAGFIVANVFKWWPGFGAMLPVLGTVLIVAAGSNAIVNRVLLRRKILVGIGLISYPLYLWHWPLLVFYRIVQEGMSPRAGRMLLILIAVVLSIITYQVIERPIRFGKHRRRSALLLLVPLGALALTGWQFRARNIEPRLASHFENAKNKLGSAGSTFLSQDRLTADRVRGKSDHVVLFIGDSHAGQYASRFRYLATVSRDSIPTVEFVVYGGCAPFPHMTRHDYAWDGVPWRCPLVYRTAREFAMRPEVKTIVVSAFWERYSRPNDLDLQDERNLKGPYDPRVEFRDLGNDIRAWVRAGKTVYIVGPNPTHEFTVNGVRFSRRLYGITNKQQPVLTRAEMDRRLAPANLLIHDELVSAGAILIRTVDYLCNKAICPDTASDGRPIYRDDDHLGPNFVARHATYVDRVLKTADH
jgi:peptidoglycan/LPS O-acetylase OafA/YrhL